MTCPTCGHSYKCPAGWPRCLEMIPCKEEPGRTVCVCTDQFHAIGYEDVPEATGPDGRR